MYGRACAVTLVQMFVSDHEGPGISFARSAASVVET